MTIINSKSYRLQTGPWYLNRALVINKVNSISLKWQMFWNNSIQIQIQSMQQTHNTEQPFWAGNYSSRLNLVERQSATESNMFLVFAVLYPNAQTSGQFLWMSRWQEKVHQASFYWYFDQLHCCHRRTHHVALILCSSKSKQHELRIEQQRAH